MNVKVLSARFEGAVLPVFSVHLMELSAVQKIALSKVEVSLRLWEFCTFAMFVQVLIGHNLVSRPLEGYRKLGDGWLS
jgi:hypothetical protein